MKIKYLGTAAFEGIPSLFCCCKACKDARKQGGKDIRTRTQSVIDDKLLIDFPADTYMHFINNNIDFSKFNNILITHNHSDHLYAEDIMIRSKNFSVLKENSPLNIFVGESGKKIIQSICKSMIENGELNIHEIKPFESFNIMNYEIMPILASHDINSSPFIFIINDGAKSMLYGNDTGVLKDEVLSKLLEMQVKFDLLSLDCTMGEKEPGYYGHFNLKECINFVNILKENNSLNENCKVVLTHFSHNHYVSHKYLEDKVHCLDYKVSYDGYEIDF